MVHELKVPVGLEEKVVAISVDPQTGKASIRVDGRLVGRPMAPDEDRREIQVGSDRYEVRREWDQFELEFIGPAEVAAVNMTPAVGSRGSTSRAGADRRDEKRSSRTRNVVIGVGVALLGALILFGVPIYTSAVSGWQTYTNPDGTFTVSLPGEPHREREFVTIPGGATYTHTLTLARGPYEYAISYFNLPVDYHHGSDREMVEAMRQFMIREYRGEVIQESRSNNAAQMRIRFRGLDTGDGNEPANGDLHVEIRITANRAYILGASAPFDKLDSAPVKRFLYSFRVDGTPIMDIPQWLKL